MTDEKDDAIDIVDALADELAEDLSDQIAEEAKHSFVADEAVPQQGINLQDLSNTINDGLTTLRAAMHLMPKSKSLNNADLYFSTGILWLTQAMQEFQMDEQKRLAKQKREKVIAAAAAKTISRKKQ